MNRREFMRGAASLAAAAAAGTGFAFQSTREAYDRWGLPVFARVARAEQRHMDVMGRMLDYYGLSDPVADPSGRGGFSDTRLAKLYAKLTTRAATSTGDALQAAGLIEEVDIMDLEKAAKTAPDALLRRAYTNLERGSRNHLRGFAYAWTRLTGKPYTAQAMPQTAVDTFIASPIERGRPS